MSLGNWTTIKERAMTRNDSPIETAEDLLRFLDTADLSATRLRDLKSAINRISQMAGCSLARVLSH